MLILHAYIIYMRTHKVIDHQFGQRCDFVCLYTYVLFGFGPNLPIVQF